MSLRDEIFRNFTADGIAPRPVRCRLRFKEEDYSQIKWQKTIEVSLFSYYRTWSFASERLSTETVHFTILDVLSQIQVSVRQEWADCGVETPGKVWDFVASWSRTQNTVLGYWREQHFFPARYRPNNTATVLEGNTEW
jgi:hypothetical protein